MWAPNDNVLIVPSRNVLLTGSVLRGGFRNISHDATRPRPAGRIEESKEGPDYATASGRGAGPKRAACSPSVKAPAKQGRRSVGTCSARTAVQPQVGRQDEAEGIGDSGPRCLSGFRSHAGGGIPGQQARHSRGTGDGAGMDDRRQAVACQQAAHRQDPSVAAAPLPSGRTGPVGYQRARLAGGSWAEVVPDQHDRRRVQSPSRAVRAARFHGREDAHGVELRGAAWSAGELLHRQGGVVSNRAEDGAACDRTAPGRARPIAPDADRTSSRRIGHRVDRGALAAGQRSRGTRFPNGSGPSGEGSACGRRKNTGGGQRLSGSGVYRMVEPHDCRGPGQQRRCAPALGQRAFLGCFVELRGDQTGQQRLYDSGRSSNLADRPRRHSSRTARSRRASRGSARWFNGCALPRVLPDGEPMPATSQSAEPQSDRRPCAEACRAARQKPMDGELPPHQPRKNRSVRQRGVTTGSRRKINSVGRARTARPASRLLYSKPPLGSLTKVSLPSKAKPSEGTPQGPVNRGFAAVYFGANSVASALNLPQERDLPKNHSHSKPHLSNRTSKPDISTWQRIGHFYLALTGATSSAGQTGAAAPGDPLTLPVLTAQATIGGIAAPVQFAGLAPGFVGVMQLNLQVPNIRSGEQLLQVTMSGSKSNVAVISVKAP